MRGGKMCFLAFNLYMKSFLVIAATLSLLNNCWQTLLSALD